MNKKLIINEWYNLLVEDCKAIVVEYEFISRWSLVEGYHALGKRIVNETNLNRSDVYGKKILSSLSKSLDGVGERTLYRAIQFYKKYPVLDNVPGGKAMSWHKVVTELLPEHAEKEEKNEYQRIFKGIERWSKSIVGIIDSSAQNKIDYHVMKIQEIITESELNTEKESKGTSEIMEEVNEEIANILDEQCSTEKVEITPLGEGEPVFIDGKPKDEDRSWMDIVD